MPPSTSNQVNPFKNSSRIKNSILPYYREEKNHYIQLSLSVEAGH